MCFDRRLQSVPNWLGRARWKAAWPDIASGCESRVRMCAQRLIRIRCVGCADRCSSCDKAGPAKCDRCENLRGIEAGHQPDLCLPVTISDDLPQGFQGFHLNAEELCRDVHVSLDLLRHILGRVTPQEEGLNEPASCFCHATAELQGTCDRRINV